MCDYFQGSLYGRKPPRRRSGATNRRTWGGLTLGPTLAAGRGGGGGARAPRVGGDWLWVQSRSKKGKAYYFNKLTGETSWAAPIIPEHQRVAAQASGRSSVRPVSAPVRRSHSRVQQQQQQQQQQQRQQQQQLTSMRSSRPVSATSYRGRSRLPSSASSNARAAAAAQRLQGSQSAESPGVKGTATGLAALENDPSFVPSWMKDQKKGNIKVAEEKIALQKSNVLYPVPAVDAFSWNSTQNGVVSNAHTKAKLGEAGKGGDDTKLDKSSAMESMNATRQTSFGNRVRCMPDNPSRAGDHAWQISKMKPFVSVDAYSSSLVKDLIFGSASSQFD